MRTSCHLPHTQQPGCSSPTDPCLVWSSMVSVWSAPRVCSARAIVASSCCLPGFECRSCRWSCSHCARRRRFSRAARSCWRRSKAPSTPSWAALPCICRPCSVVLLRSPSSSSWQSDRVRSLWARETWTRLEFCWSTCFKHRQNSDPLPAAGSPIKGLDTWWVGGKNNPPPWFSSAADTNVGTGGRYSWLRPSVLKYPASDWWIGSAIEFQLRSTHLSRPDSPLSSNPLAIATAGEPPRLFHCRFKTSRLGWEEINRPAPIPPRWILFPDRSSLVRPRHNSKSVHSWSTMVSCNWLFASTSCFSPVNRRSAFSNPMPAQGDTSWRRLSPRFSSVMVDGRALSRWQAPKSVRPFSRSRTLEI
mmetsp:Transcript_46383/g.105201  ORF Transcript_46383/g.105201 Transcript_46383/m.105201 type:complete len:361 (-) Transcript_46383:665-1747(-)